MFLKDLLEQTIHFSENDTFSIEAGNDAAFEILNENPTINRVVCDSRSSNLGDIFVAIKGFDVDGHSFLRSLTNSASLAIVEELDENLNNLPQFKTKNSRRAYALLNAVINGRPSDKMHVCGITGSNGKTGCSMMLREIFKSDQRNTGLIGTVVYSSAKQEIESKLTTPDAATLQSLLKEMLDNGQNNVIMEVSSIGQDQQRDAGIKYDVVSCINISREHIDYHGSFEKYVFDKSRFIRGASSQVKCVLNADDKECMKLIPQTQAEVFTFAIDNEADMRAVNLDLSSGYGNFDLQLSDRLINAFSLDKSDSYRHIKLNVPGRHTVANSLAAALMAICSGISLDRICDGLSNYMGVERRFQEIYNGFSPLLPYKVFDDHFANAGNIDVTLRSISEMKYNKLHIVYALRGKRGVTVTRESMETFFKYADNLKLENFFASLSEDVVGYYNEVSEDERNCFETLMREQGISYTLDRTLERAISRVFDVAKSADLVLLAGCQGMDAGARIFLEQAALRYDVDEEKMMAPVKDRVCGRKGERA